MNVIKSNILKTAILTISVPRCWISTNGILNNSAKLTLISETNGIRDIKLNNPKARNALSLDMMKELLTSLKCNVHNEDLRAIILSAEGNVFSAGHNLKELTEETGKDFHAKVFQAASDLMIEIKDSPVPIIAKVDGLAAAAGCQLIAACDLVICTEKSTFSTPGANFGIFCSTPGIAVSRMIPQKQTMYMLLTGLPITAQEALRHGLVSRVVADSDALNAEINVICNAIKSKSRSVVERGKKFFYEQIQMTLKSAYKYGEQEMVDNLSMEDGQEGIQSFIEKRKPNWTHMK